MGYALAEAARSAGARVTLISGPVNLAAPDGVDRVEVTSAEDMHSEVMLRIKTPGIFISVAAVADYRIDAPSREKIKKTKDDLTLTLVRNPDILSAVANSANRPFCVGFAAETQNLEQYARLKLEEKNLDMIIANLVGNGRAFGSDNNTVEVFWRDGGTQSFALQSKRALADSLIDLLAKRYNSVSS